jgi:predicted RNase H-like HicB family nuclease
MNNQYHFKVLFEQCQDGTFRAWAPSLPACQASGTSMAQARAHIQEAIRCYCLNMLENGAYIPQNPPGLPSVVDEIQIQVSPA